LYICLTIYPCNELPSQGNLVVYQCQNFKGLGRVTPERKAKGSNAKSILWFRSDTCQIVSFFFINLSNFFLLVLADFAISSKSNI